MNNIKISNIILLFLTCLTLFHHGLCIIAASETVVLLKSVNNNNNNDKFEKLNIFLSSLTVTIPTVQLSIDFQGSPVTILLQDLICTDLSLSSIRLRSNENVGMTKVSEWEEVNVVSLRKTTWKRRLRGRSWRSTSTRSRSR